MDIIEMWDRGDKVNQIAISAGVHRHVVVADIEDHGRHIRGPLPENPYKQINEMIRAARNGV